MSKLKLYKNGRVKPLTDEEFDNEWHNQRIGISNIERTIVNIYLGKEVLIRHGKDRIISLTFEQVEAIYDLMKKELLKQ